MKTNQLKAESVIDVEDQRNGEIKKNLTAEEDDPWSLPELTDTGIPWQGKLLYTFYLCLVLIIFIDKTARKRH